MNIKRLGLSWGAVFLVVVGCMPKYFGSFLFGQLLLGAVYRPAPVRVPNADPVAA